jgi:phage terminase large subunit-like protein
LYNPESLRNGLLAARGDSTWLDVERLIEEIYDPNTKVSNARRFYLNHVTATEDAWVSRQEWDSCAKPRKLERGETITLGLDGSKSDDHTVLTACAVSDSHLVCLGIWRPLECPGGVVPLKDVDAYVERAFEEYDVVGFYSDVKELESYIDIWEEDFGSDLCVKASNQHAVAFDMRQRKRDATMAIEALYDAIIEGQCTHDGDPKVSQYVYNARRAANPYGVSVRKENPSSDKKIDFTITAALARKARQDYLLLPENKKRRKRGISLYIPEDE